MGSWAGVWVEAGAQPSTAAQAGPGGEPGAKDEGEGLVLPGRSPAQLQVCGRLLDLLQTPSVTSLEAPVAVSGRGRVRKPGPGQAHGMGWDPVVSRAQNKSRAISFLYLP